MNNYRNQSHVGSGSVNTWFAELDAKCSFGMSLFKGSQYRQRVEHGHQILLGQGSAQPDMDFRQMELDRYRCQDRQMGDYIPPGGNLPLQLINRKLQQIGYSAGNAQHANDVGQLRVIDQKLDKDVMDFYEQKLRPHQSLLTNENEAIAQIQQMSGISAGLNQMPQLESEIKWRREVMQSTPNVNQPMPEDIQMETSAQMQEAQQQDNGSKRDIAEIAKRMQAQGEEAYAQAAERMYMGMVPQNKANVDPIVGNAYDDDAPMRPARSNSQEVAEKSKADLEESINKVPPISGLEKSKNFMKQMGNIAQGIKNFGGGIKNGVKNVKDRLKGIGANRGGGGAGAITPPVQAEPKLIHEPDEEIKVEEEEEEKKEIPKAEVIPDAPAKVNLIEKERPQQRPASAERKPAVDNQQQSKLAKKIAQFNVRIKDMGGLNETSQKNFNKQMDHIMGMDDQAAQLKQFKQQMNKYEVLVKNKAKQNQQRQQQAEINNRGAAY